MKLKIQSDVFLRGLQLAASVAEKKNSLAMLGNVLIDAHAKGIRLTATDLEIGVIAELEADVEEPGKVTVSAKHLLDIVRMFARKSEVRIKSLPNCWVQVNSGGGEFKLMGLSPDDFANLPANDADMIDVDGHELLVMIRRVFYAMSDDSTRLNLNGMLLEQNGGGFRVVATDGHRLALADGKLTEKKAKFGNAVVIPSKGVAAIAKVLESNPESVKIGVKGNDFALTTDDVGLMVRLTDNSFPEYGHVVPVAQRYMATMNGAELAATLRRAVILAPDRTCGVRLVFGGNTLTVLSTNPDCGESKEELAIESNTESLAVGFNGKYLLDSLGALGDGKISVSVEDDLSPMILKVDETSRAIVMPMRI